jgi:serine/threonine-protein kinase HipA
VLISNTDDHPRNHAILEGHWLVVVASLRLDAKSDDRGRASRSYDGVHCGRYANRSNLISRCERFLVSKADAAIMIGHMIEVIGAS